MRIAGRRDRGFTLVEVMVAIGILFISMLALLWALSMAVRHNLNNLMLDEAVRVADQQMNALRNTAFTGLTSSTSTTQVTATRRFRNTSVDFLVTWNVQNLSASNSRAIQVVVRWSWNGRNHQHSTASIVSVDS